MQVCGEGEGEGEELSFHDNKRMRAPLLSLDLFSGIGGLTMSLTGLVEPLVYCDINPDALAVLSERMRSGQLPKAAMSTDVRTLTPR